MIETPPPPPVPAAELPSAPPPPERQEATPEFHGSGQEYFRIWIVNLVLSIITLGLYVPWARVRTRRYFYENTTLFDAPFAYLAEGRQIFFGYLIIGVLYLTYSLSSSFLPLLAVLIGLIGLVSFPWLIYKGLRFKAANSAYRNVPFSFAGTCQEAYSVFLGYAFLAGITFGILWPMARFKQTEYAFDNLSYGPMRSQYRGTAGFFFKAYFSLFGLAIVMFLGAAFSMGIMIGFLNQMNGGQLENNEILLTGLTLLPIMGLYGPLLIGWVFVSALERNYNFNNLYFTGEMEFVSAINPWRYVWIVFSNLLLTVLTLGFFLPWAKVRLHRYHCACLLVETNADLEAISSEAVEERNALGDSAVEAFDFDFGF